MHSIKTDIFVNGTFNKPLDIIIESNTLGFYRVKLEA